jgi:hypothetical protein
MSVENIAGSWRRQDYPSSENGPIKTGDSLFLPRQTSTLHSAVDHTMANIGGPRPIPELESDNGSPGKGPSRIRSRVACRGCNQRKVRCDVTRTGLPCSNCVHDATTCEVLPRKKHR